MTDDRDGTYDAVIVIGFGGPEGHDDVIPFLQNVTRGRDVPPARVEHVANHYHQFGGVSPINEHCRRIRSELETELGRRGQSLEVYWGNRHWHPYLSETVADMVEAGVRRALAVVMSAYSSHAGCRQYLEAIEAARADVGPSAPVIDKVRAFSDHPGFVEPLSDAIIAARQRIPEPNGTDAKLVCTAHSIPVAMAERCDYQHQLGQTAALVAARAGFDDWDLAWQSRSGPATVPWLGPDINDHLRHMAGTTEAVVVAPIGFVSDHMEVVWDLDVEAAATASSAGLHLERAETPGTGPDRRFIAMLSDLVEERLEPDHPRLALGAHGPRPDECPAQCCLAPARR